MQLVSIFVVLLAVYSVSALDNPKKKPIEFEKAATARWMAHELSWGAFGTISLHLDGAPFVQSKSFVDGTIANSTGTIYMFDSTLDASTQDALANPSVSFALTEAQIPGHCNEKVRDPESPVCARVVFSGDYTPVNVGTEEDTWARQALYERHPTMEQWPHDFAVYKLALKKIWVIDIYGGASDVDIEKYYAAKVRY
jgi:hypothetical protein